MAPLYIRKQSSAPGRFTRRSVFRQVKQFLQKKLNAAAKKSGRVGREARFAKTLKGLKKK